MFVFQNFFLEERVFLLLISAKQDEIKQYLTLYHKYCICLRSNLTFLRHKPSSPCQLNLEKDDDVNEVRRNTETSKKRNFIVVEVKKKTNRLNSYCLTTIMLQKSAVILAGGFSRRFGKDKGLVNLDGKPLVLHVIDRVSKIVDEVLVVISSNDQKNKFETILGEKANLVIDKDEFQSPLVGAITGFESANGEYSLLLPCDTPLISIQILQFLLDMCTNRSAVIPRWPSGYIEPLQAVYHTKSALTAAKTVLMQGKMNMRSMIDNLRGVRYVSTMVLEQMEPKLLTFFNVNTPQDLKKVESILK